MCLIIAIIRLVITSQTEQRRTQIEITQLYRLSFRNTGCLVGRGS